MSNYNSLKATINANIKTNGNQEITGNILNSVLNAIVNTLGAGYQYAGIATSSTNPGTPDANVFYIAATAGTYTNMGGLVVFDGEVAILKYNGSWTKDVTGVATAEQVSQLSQKIGNGIIERVSKGTSDFTGLIWNGSAVGNANANYNSMLFEVIGGEQISINVVGATSIVAFTNYPTVGQTNGVQIQNKDYIVPSGIHYILVTVYVPWATSEHEVCILYKKKYGIKGEISNIHPQPKIVKTYSSEHLSGLLYSTSENKVRTSFNSEFSAYLLELKPYTEYKITGTVYNICLFDKFPTVDTVANKLLTGRTFSSEDYKYVLLNVRKDNADIIIEIGAYYLLNSRVQEINELIGNNLIGKIFTSDDYSGLIWDNNNTVVSNANANYDSFIIKVSTERKYRISADHPILSIVAFENYPVLGETDGYTLSNSTYDFSFIPDDNKNYIIVTIPLISGTTQISLYSEDSGLVKTLRIANPLRNKKIITFGDSLTDFVDNDGYGYSHYLADMTGADCLCAGFGGSRISKSRGYHVTPTNEQEAESSFDLVNLFSAIITNEWTAQDNAADYIATHQYSVQGERWKKRIAELKAVNWSNIDMITIFAGTNDWRNAVEMGTSGSDDETCVLGAINIIMRMITTNFPKVRVHWFTPIVRWIASTLEERTDANWSDNYRPNGGMTLREFSESVHNEVLRNHQPCYDTYNRLGWTKYNFSQYFIDNDGTHPYKGFEYIGNRFSSVIQSEI